jgi:hypothetical protein
MWLADNSSDFDWDFHDISCHFFALATTPASRIIPSKYHFEEI